MSVDIFAAQQGLPADKQPRTSSEKLEEHHGLVLDAHHVLYEFVYEHWLDHVDSIRIVCDKTPRELYAIGHLPVAEALPICQRLLSVPCIGEEVGRSLYQHLRDKALEAEEISPWSCPSTSILSAVADTPSRLPTGSPTSPSLASPSKRKKLSLGDHVEKVKEYTRLKRRNESIGGVMAKSPVTSRTSQQESRHTSSTFPSRSMDEGVASPTSSRKQSLASSGDENDSLTLLFRLLPRRSSKEKQIDTLEPILCEDEYDDVEDRGTGDGKLYDDKVVVEVKTEMVDAGADEGVDKLKDSGGEGGGGKEKSLRFWKSEEPQPVLVPGQDKGDLGWQRDGDTDDQQIKADEADSEVNQEANRASCADPNRECDPVSEAPGSVRDSRRGSGGDVDASKQRRSMSRGRKGIRRAISKLAMTTLKGNFSHVGESLASGYTGSTSSASSRKTSWSSLTSTDSTDSIGE